MNPNEVVYISNIPKQTSLADLHGFIKSSGNVVGSTFMRENRNDCRTKIAFVLFENEAQAMDACDLDQTLFQSHRLSVLLSNDDRKFLAGYTIVVENTSPDTSEEDLFEACCRYGNVDAVQIPTNYYAFVMFSERSAAHAAQRKLDNSILKQHQVAVKVLDDDVRVRLEDLDSYKTPRVYNELLRAKQQYFANQQPNRNDIHQIQRRDQNDQLKNEQFYDNIDDDSVCQFNQNDPNDYDLDMEQPEQEQEHQEDLQQYSDEDDGTAVVYRRDITFGKPRFITANKTAVKVENIPRDVYDEDVIIFFQKFGPILSIERGLCLNAVYTKVFTITYMDEESQRRAIHCFSRQVVLSNITCKIFTMIPGESLLGLPNRSVLVSYISKHVMYSEIVDAFSHIGDIMYVEKKVRNQGPTVVHFTHPINMNEACLINCIATYMVYVAPVNLKEYQKFAANMMSFKRSAKRKLKGTQKYEYLQELAAKEEAERVDNIIFKTAHDPHYRNPNPKKYSFEVAVYNCPKNTTIARFRSYFNRAGHVLAMRHEQDKYDPDTWRVFVSFANYLEAFRAIRLKGKLNAEFIFKHIAAETPKLDCLEAVKVKVLSGMREMVKQNGPQNCSNTLGDNDAKDDRPRVLLSDIFAETDAADEKPCEPDPAERVPEQMPKVAMNIKKEPCDSPKASTSGVTAQRNPSPEKDSKKERRDVIAVQRVIKTEYQQNQLNELEEMERFIKQKEQDIQRRLEKLERDEANITTLLPSTTTSTNSSSTTKRMKSPERKAKDPASSSSGLGSSRGSSSNLHRGSPARSDSFSTSNRISTLTTTMTTVNNNPTPFPAAKPFLPEQMRSVSPSDRLAHERYMQIRVEKIAITQELDSLRQRFDYRKGSRVDALRDLLAGLNREQREIQIQLEAKWRFRMPEDASYAGSSFDMSPPRSSRRDSNRSLSRSRSPYRSPARSRSPLPPARRYGRSRTGSRSRSPPSRRSNFLRSRTRSRSPRTRNIPSRSRSPSPQRRRRLARVSRSPSPQYSQRNQQQNRRRSRTPSTGSRSPTLKRGYSLERDMYNIGRFNTYHGKHGVYVGNIDSKVSDREIEEIFARYGRLNHVDWTRRKRYGEINIDYTNREDAFKALEMNNAKIMGRRLRVAFNMDKPSNREGFTLYFKLRQLTNEMTIYRTYKPFGDIDFIWYPEDCFFGTISFRRPESATNALVVKELCDGTIINSRPFIDKVARGQ
uniref:RRM domain-containing protein n=1 Tax=Anopheles dirus TaxID=7168 RepID=A0A182NS17_9DIPT